MMKQIRSYVALGSTLLLAGCHKAPQEVATPAEPTPQPALIVSEPQATPQPRPEPPAPKDPPVVLPSDLGGKAVAAVVRPSPSLPPVDSKTTAPKPRTSDVDRVESTHRGGIAWTPTDSIPRPTAGKPTPPPERSPANLGQAAMLGAKAVVLKEAPLAKASTTSVTGAADVPAQARQVPDRASLDDPTTDLTAARVILTPLPLPLDPLPFLKPVIPDPFEYKDHLKSKTGRDAEFATTPARIPPEKK